MFYQVQLQKLDGSWEPFGAAHETRAKAEKRYCEYFLGHWGWSDQFKAIRVASVWQHLDKSWTIREILQYKDIAQ